MTNKAEVLGSGSLFLISYLVYEYDLYDDFSFKDMFVLVVGDSEKETRDCTDGLIM